MRALELSGLIGKYVRIERPATEEEIKEGSPKTVGGSGLVSLVADTQHGVEIMWDYGMSFEMRHNETWRAVICDNGENLIKLSDSWRYA
jgi:hypothetical protein